MAKKYRYYQVQGNESSVGLPGTTYHYIIPAAKMKGSTAIDGGMVTKDKIDFLNTYIKEGWFKCDEIDDEPEQSKSEPTEEELEKLTRPPVEPVKLQYQTLPPKMNNK